MAPKKPADQKSAASEGSDLVAFNLRMPRSLLEAIDARVAALNAQGGGPKWTRADWLRSIAERAVKTS